MPGQATITINENQWNVWVATTYTELTTGLRGVASIAAGTGMLFVLPSKQAVSVDTREMSFPIDIIFISESTVIDVASNIQPGYLVTEETPYDMFLEVNAGEATDVETGDTVATVTIQQLGVDLGQIISFAIPLAALGFVCAMAGGVMKLAGGSSSPGYSSPKRLSSGGRVTVKCPICGKEIKIPEHDSITRSEALKKHIEAEHSRREEYGTCYEDAWRFLIKTEEGDLVHGSVESKGKIIKHAWVEMPTGFVWEPETARFIRLDDFNVAFKPIPKVYGKVIGTLFWYNTN